MHIIMNLGIKNITVRIPKTTIPTQQTTYVRTYVELPIDGDYHLVGSKPFLDNVHVVHHIELYGCDEYDGPINRPLNTPLFETGWSQCSNLFAAWTVGLKGTCHEGDKAVRFGATKGYKIAVMETSNITTKLDNKARNRKNNNWILSDQDHGVKQQQLNGLGAWFSSPESNFLHVHWNNPEGYSNLTDSSGMTLFYTSKLRKHDFGIITIGQMSINIPPRLDRIAISGTCSSECTREKITGPIYIASLRHHMHHNGVYFITFLSQLCTRYARHKEYEEKCHYFSIYYAKPLIPIALITEFYGRTLKTPIQMLPGDEVKMTCLYTSKYKTTPTFYGRGINSEMCFGFVDFYPIENSPLSRCIDDGNNYQSRFLMANFDFINLYRTVIIDDMENLEN
ncbi:hypothetical protein KUTeg_021955 [Tegillarca granosa]|uniref:Uncharacterized protein n=1 Tax=Tegillarca granosa TaxID=220873 RepID=A0ABQ9E7R6_TEGGR|nr:hypothetical protein KUTeg_021955 [Tegillarca granosa]